MAKGGYSGVENVSRKIKKGYIGDENGIARKLKKVYVGDENGKARLCWSGKERIFVSMFPQTATAYYTPMAVTSNDGANWTLHQIGNFTTIYSMTTTTPMYGNEKFVSTIYDYNVSTSKYTNYIFTSEDGEHWTKGVDVNLLPWSNNNFTYGNGKFVLTSTSACWYSTDTINWTKSASYNTNNCCDYHVCYANGMYYGVGQNRRFSYSYDAENWTTNIYDLMGTEDYKYYHKVCYGNGVFVLLQGGTMNIGVSKDYGKTWSYNLLPYVGYYGIYDSAQIFFKDGMFYIYEYKTFYNYNGGASACVTKYTSTDGINWGYYGSNLLPYDENLYFNSLTYNNGVIIMRHIYNGIYYSLDDGNTWSVHPSAYFMGGVSTNVDGGKGDLK